MIGLKAERNLLAAVIVQPNYYRFTTGLVSGDNFSDARLGIIYDRIGDMLVRGETVGFIEVVDKFPEWGVKNLDFAEMIQWDDGKVHAPSSASYARHIRSEALRRAAETIGRTMLEGVADAGTAPADVLSKAHQAVEKVLDGASSGVLVPKPLAEVLDGDYSYDWVIPDLLEREDRLILTGGEGAGKSTLVQQLCILSAAGIHPLKFHRIDPVRVLVIDAENSERQWRRAVQYMTRKAKDEGAVDPSLAVQIVAGKRIDVTRGSHLSEIHRLVDVHKPDLLYIGPLYKITSGAIQTDDDAAPLLLALDSLRERGLAMVMEAHAAKGSSEHVREWRPRGSAALMGWPEMGLGLSRVNDAGDVELVRWRGDRDERMWPQFLRRGFEWPWEAA